MADASIFKADILKAAKQSSLSLEPKASDRLNAYLLSLYGSRPDDWSLVKESLHEVLNKIKTDSGGQVAKLTAAQVETAIASIQASAKGVDQISNAKVIDVISAYDQPRFHYDTVKKIWFEVKADRSKFGVAEEKADMQRSRYSMLLQRIQRLPAFQPQKAVAGASMEDETPPLCTIESLMGQTGKKVIFGQLCQLTEGVYSLEDIHAHIRLDLSGDVVLSSGLFTEGCLVLVEGEVTESGSFKAATLIQPPAEPRLTTLKTFPALDWLGSDLSAGTKVDPEKLLKIQLLRSPAHREDMIVILSDVFLDQPETLRRMAIMLAGYAELKPKAFVLMGNFCSTALSARPGEMEKLRSWFNGLAELIGKFPGLARESQWVFIPGPRDPPMSLGNCLPSPGLPSVLTARLREKISNVSFGSNPCRLSWIHKELLFFREDLLHKLRRNCIRPPSEMETIDASQHLVKTVLDQGHLCPLPLDKRPIYWNADHALRLYPLPDLLVLADVVDPYAWPYSGVEAANPGSFASDGQFMVYYPGRDVAGGAQRTAQEKEREPVIEFCNLKGK